jgi:hypothetical protein
MMNEIPIEILELPNQLREKFTGKVNRPDISQSNVRVQRRIITFASIQSLGTVRCNTVVRHLYAIP